MSVAVKTADVICYITITFNVIRYCFLFYYSSFSCYLGVHRRDIQPAKQIVLSYLPIVNCTTLTPE